MRRKHRKMIAAFQLEDAEAVAGGFGRSGESSVERTLQRLDQILDLVIPEASRQPKGSRMNHEKLARKFFGSHQPDAKKVVYSGLQRSAATPQFAAQQLSDVIVKLECHAHITMLSSKA